MEIGRVIRQSRQVEIKKVHWTVQIDMFIAVIGTDGTMYGLFTSQVDAWLVAKPLGATMWRCRPNSQECSVVASRVHPSIEFTDDKSSAEDF